MIVIIVIFFKVKIIKYFIIVAIPQFNVFIINIFNRIIANANLFMIIITKTAVINFLRIPKHSYFCVFDLYFFIIIITRLNFSLILKIMS